MTKIEKPTPYSSSNNPNEYEELTDQQKNALHLWIDETLEPLRISKYNNSPSSYYLKHLFEESENGFYISNGVFKGAMLAAGFEPAKRDELNWHFKLSNKTRKIGRGAAENE